MTDLRRELALIEKHIRQHNREAGESITWYEFLALGAGSTYDDIYDEGAVGAAGRSYAAGVIIPTIYVDEIEDKFTMNEEARQPTQTIEVTMMYQDVLRAGINEPWEYQPHLNDMLNYDSRFYKVSSYRVRGRAPSDVLVVVQAFQIYVDQDMMWDNAPASPSPVSDLFPSQFPTLPV